MTSVAVVGEALVDIAEAPLPGGSPLNVAVGLARLEQDVTFFARFSTDEYGALLRAYAAEAGLDLSHAVTTGSRSTVARVELDAAGVATYAFDVAGTADFGWTEAEIAPLPAGARIVHFGSLASWLPPGDAVIDRRIARMRWEGGTLVSYDPNVRPALLQEPDAARYQIEHAIELSHVVKASIEDVAWLYGPGASPEVIADEWLQLGAELVVITLGSEGAFGATGSCRVQRPSVPVEVVDTVGAGDAFTAGLLDHVLRHELAATNRLTDLTEAELAALLDEAGLVAALTCARVGANPPTRTELLQAQ